jgi:hypothetical protein
VNGPENYYEADLILTSERCDYGCPHTGCQHEMRMIALAQVHMLGALTAAVVAGADLNPADRHEWQKAIDREYAAECAAEVRP